MFHTKDGGSTWSVIDYVRPSDSFKAKDGPQYVKYAVHFVDPDWAWRISPLDPEAVEYTKDGARSWSEPIKTGVKLRTSVVFVTREVGWVLGDLPVVTLDGGRTWREENALANLRLEHPYFLDERHGWFANYWGVVARTTHGGQHWTIIKTPLRQVRSLFFLTPDDGWAVGDDGLVAYTVDGGINWRFSEAPVPYDSTQRIRSELLDVFFLTSKQGWIAGHNGLVLKTINGGQSWARTPTPTKAPLSSIRFSDASRGWAVSGASTSVIPGTPPSNVVLETDDGGTSCEVKNFGDTSAKPN